MEKERGDERKDDQQKRKGKMVEIQIKDAKKQPSHYKCPRCESSNTKFCYYNNYSITQPRYICKNCKRYWTQGGCQRNVPIGGGIRKVKRGKDSLSNSNGEVDSSSNVTPLPPIMSLYGMTGLLTRSFGSLPRNQAMGTSSLEANPPINSINSCNRSSIPYNLGTSIKNMNPTPLRGNFLESISVSDGFNRYATERLLQVGVPPIQGRVPPIQGRGPAIQGGVPPIQRGVPPILDRFSPIQDRVPPIQGGIEPILGKVPLIQYRVPPIQGGLPPIDLSINSKYIINRGKESKFLGDFVPDGKSFQDMKNDGNHITYQPNQSFNQTPRPIDFWKQDLSINNNIYNIKPLSPSNNYKNNLTEFDHMHASSSTSWNNFHVNNNNDDEHDNNNNVPKASPGKNEWPDFLPDYDPPEI